jgi:MrcB-like, N-terminal domain
MDLRSRRPLAGHALARLARHDFPDAVRAVIPEERYLIVGSAGQGRWAEAPWAAVFDRLITDPPDKDSILSICSGVTSAEFTYL